MGDSDKYWLGFSLVKGIGPIRLRHLLETFGDVEQAWNASERALAASGLSPRVLEALLSQRAGVDLDHELGRLTEAGYRLISWADQDYPQRLSEIDAPPIVLYLWGTLSCRPAAAVIGTRRPTRYGRSVAGDIACALAASGVSVVSGLARGIDAIAHQSALDAGGHTYAVLGSGLDRIYPPEHRGLAQRIAEQGAILSDYPLGTEPEAKNFPPRNRIIAGLSTLVVVVEAGERSGTMITVGFANEQGREVFAVPGSIYSPASRGCLNLLRSGARIYSGHDDLLEALNHELVLQQGTRQWLPGGEHERLLLRLLEDGPLHVDEIQAASRLSMGEVSASLSLLEIRGFIRQVGTMTFTRIWSGGELRDGVG